MGNSAPLGVRSKSFSVKERKHDPRDHQFMPARQRLQHRLPGGVHQRRGTGSGLADLLCRPGDLHRLRRLRARMSLLGHLPARRGPGRLPRQRRRVAQPARLDESYQGTDHYGAAVALPSARQLAPGEVIDLRESIRRNQAFYQ